MTAKILVIMTYTDVVLAIVLAVENDDHFTRRKRKMTK